MAASIEISSAMEGHVFTTKELLNFMYETIRLFQIEPIDKSWLNSDPTRFKVVTANFRAQPLVRLIENVIRRSGRAHGNVSQLNDVILLIQQSLNSNLEELTSQGMFDAILPWIGLLTFEKRSIAIREPINPHSLVQEDHHAVAHEIDQSIWAAVNAEDLSTSPIDVVIHVVDDVRGSHKDFHCLAKTLLEKMPYFVKATKGNFINQSCNERSLAHFFYRMTSC